MRDKGREPARARTSFIAAGCRCLPIMAAQSSFIPSNIVLQDWQTCDARIHPKSESGPAVRKGLSIAASIENMFAITSGGREAIGAHAFMLARQRASAADKSRASSSSWRWSVLRSEDVLLVMMLVTPSSTKRWSSRGLRGFALYMTRVNDKAAEGNNHENTYPPFVTC